MSRRLRQYKGVTDRDGHWRVGQHKYGKAAEVIAIRCGVEEWADADHAALLDLKANPTENAPDAVVETIASEFKLWYTLTMDEVKTSVIERTAATVRALVRAEGEGEQTAWSEQALEDVVRSAVREWQNTAHKTGADYSECVANAVRAAGFSQQTTPPLTVTEHVAALVGMGARVYSNIADDEMRFAGRRDLVLLPPEAP
jgi:hypothetical protein